MEFSGIIKTILPARTGTSKQDPAKTWISQTFVVEQADVQYPVSLALSAFGQDKIDACRLQLLKPGDRVKVYYDPYAREHNGYWSTELRAWKVDNAQ